MKRRLSLILVLVVTSGFACSTVFFPVSLSNSAKSSAVNSPTPFPQLPGRPTPTVRPTSTPSPVLVITSPFIFPTSSAISSTPVYDCSSIFPLENIEAIEFGRTTIQQLESTFGRGTYHTGRPVRFKFEEGGCTLFIEVGTNEAQEVELLNYGTLEMLLERYGRPVEVGISQGNLTLLAVDAAVLFYPEQGVIAVFDVSPDQLTLTTPISQLFFRLAYQVDKQLKRLNVQPVEWQAPIVPSP